MDHQQFFDAVRRQIAIEADRGLHVLSITLSQKLSAFPPSPGFDCPVYHSSGLLRTEFILSLRGSPSDRHVNFYRAHDKDSL